MRQRHHVERMTSVLQLVKAAVVEVELERILEQLRVEQSSTGFDINWRLVLAVSPRISFAPLARTYITVSVSLPHTACAPKTAKDAYHFLCRSPTPRRGA